MRTTRFLKALLCLLAACLLLPSMVLAGEYRLSADFDRLEGVPHALHTVRVLALAQGVTQVTVAGGGGGSPVTVRESLAGPGGKDFRVRSGDIISTDQPVLAIEYGGDGAAALVPVAAAGGALSWNGVGYLLAGALYDGTEMHISAAAGEERVEILKSGTVALCDAAGGAVTITASKAIQAYGGSFDDALFRNGFLLLPDSEAYVPLRVLIPHSAPAGDRHASSAGPRTVLDRVMYWVGTAIETVIGGTPAYAAATSEGLTDNGDGTFTFTQRIDYYSTPPHYTGPWYSYGGSTSWIGFGNYNWYNQDWGWQHSFPYFDQPSLQVLSSTLTVRAWDVDAEPWHGYEGEYDGISGDGNWLNPQYLQGTDSNWSVTNFDVDTAALADGILNVWMDLDMHHNYENWATTLDYSLLTVRFTYTDNAPPYAPQVTIAPVGCTYDNDTLTVNVVGPTPADPDGDQVTYQYRWLVDPGTGNFIDDEFAGRGNNTGNTVPASATRNNDRWRVEVIPVDNHGARGTKAVVSFATIGQCNTPPIADAGVDRKVCPGTVLLSGKASRDSGGSIAAYLWELYQGGRWVTIGTTQEVTRDFADKGIYQVRLTVTDNQGASDDAIVYITVDDGACGLSNVRVIDTIPSTDVAFVLSSASQAPYSVTSAGGNTVVEWRFGSFGTEQSENIAFDLNLSNLVPGESRLVDHQLQVVYNDKSGKEVSYFLPPLYVNVLLSPFTGTVATDKVVYGDHENAAVTATAENLSRYPRTVDVKVLVEDAAGGVLKESLHAAESFASGAQKSFGLNFDTGTSYAGDYRAHLVLTENGAKVGEAFGPFKIAAVKGAASAIGTDKASYGANEAVGIASVVRSTSPNYILENLTARITLSDAAGNRLFSEVKQIQALLQGQTAEFGSSWNTASHAKGRYTVGLEVSDASNAVLSTSATSFDILGTSATGMGIVGTIDAQPTPVEQGQEERVAYALTNTGNEDLATLPLSIVIADAATMEVKLTVPATVALAMGASMAENVTVPTTDLKPGPYLALLRVSPSGSTLPKTLARGKFEVVIPAKPQIEVSKSVSGTGNYLVWLNYPWTSGEKLPDRGVIERALQEAGCLYRIVLDKSEFEKELHNQLYTDFVILGDQLPIEDHFSEVLREQVYQGKGLATSLFTRLNLDQAVFGVKNNGQLSATDYPVALAAGPLSTGETFQTTGRAVRVEAFNLGEVAGWLSDPASKEQPKYPAALLRQYGQGKVVFTAFDLGMSTRNYQPFARLLASVVRQIHSPVTSTSFNPGQLVPVELTVQARADNLTLRIDESYPGEVRLYELPSKQLIPSNPWSTEFSLLMDQKRTFQYYALLPEKKGSYVVDSGVSFVSDGQWREYGAFPLDLSVPQDAAEILDAVAVELSGLHPTNNQEVMDVAAARASLEKIPRQPRYTAVELDAIIHELLKAVDAIIDIETVDTEQVRKELDRLLAVYEAKWYDSSSAVNP